MKKIKLLLFLSLSLLISLTSNAEEVTTGNLLDQNFDNGSWSGTADGRHGSGTIAAHNDEYITSDDISLRNDANLTQEQINDGFTTNHSFQYWHWNDFNSTVQSTAAVIFSAISLTVKFWLPELYVPGGILLSSRAKYKLTMSLI